MEDCVFCKIINNQIESKKIYENEKVLIILDINPIAKGHALVIPKKHFENIFDIDEEDLREIISVAKRMSLDMKEKLNAEGINILHASGKEAQQSVFHFHIHLVPRFKGDNLDVWPKSNYRELNFNEVADKLR